jgi:transposase
MRNLIGSIELKHERVDDLPLLLGLLEQLQLPRILDQHLGRHHLHKGLSYGHLGIVWLAFLLSEADHRKIAVQPWTLYKQHTLEALLRQAVLPADFTDDRLGLLLRRLARADWSALEADLWQACCLVFDFTFDRVRLDSTTVSGYHDPKPNGLMQRGHSKDHRPDLPQLKLMAAAAQPYGYLLACDVVSGEKADDPLYTPLIQRVRRLLDRKGLLYVGDCKMAALATRGELVHAGDFYLTVLPLTGTTPQEMAGWIETTIANSKEIVELRLQNHGREELLGEGREWWRNCQTKVDKETVRWKERIQLIRTCGVWQAQQKHLEEKLSKAEKEMKRLTPASGRGRQVYRAEGSLASAVTQIMERHGVIDLLAVAWQQRRQVRQRYVGRGRPGVNRARTEEVKVRYEITAVKRQEKAIAARKERLGWRAQVTNVPKGKMSLLECLLTYREGWCLERDFHLIKAKPLGIDPLYVQKDEQILGLTRLLTLGLRVVTWLEIRVREELTRRKEELADLYEGHARKTTVRPTAQRLLSAISRLEITLTHVRTPTAAGWHLSPLPQLLRKTLELLNLPCSLYEGLVDQSS